jgi:hypothetical protein
MADFLSREWISELDAAARASGAHVGSADARLTIEQVVRDAPAGEVRYQIRFAAGTVRVVPGADEPADLVLVSDYASARGLHSGALSAQDALVRGGVKVRGNPDVLVRHSETLAALDDIFAEVRDRTTFPESPLRFAQTEGKADDE